MISSRPYLLRAMYDWISDNQMTPHILVDANIAGNQIPQQYVVDGRLILNISATATRKLLLNNEVVEFDARFGTQIFHICVPIPAILAIYAQENGRGMIFEGEEETTTLTSPTETPPTSPDKPSKPRLRIVK